MKILLHVVCWFLVFYVIPVIVADELVSENFESYEVDTIVVDQGEWTMAPGLEIYGSEVKVGPVLGSKGLNGRDTSVSSQQHFAFHPIPPLEESDIYTLSFTAHADSGTVTPPITSNSCLGYRFSNGKNVYWCANGVANGGIPDQSWYLVIPGPDGAQFAVPNAYDREVDFEIVLDRDSGHILGRYDLNDGQGMLDTPIFTTTSVDLGDVIGILVLQDFRTPSAAIGARYDNVVLINDDRAESSFKLKKSEAGSLDGILKGELNRIGSDAQISATVMYNDGNTNISVDCSVNALDPIIIVKDPGVSRLKCTYSSAEEKMKVRFKKFLIPEGVVQTATISISVDDEVKLYTTHTGQTLD